MSAAMNALPPQLPAKIRDRLARPVVLIYWLMLGSGLALYTAEMGSSLPLWVGAIAGTVLGHCLALRDFRFWFVAAICAGAVYIGVMAAPRELSGPQLYMTFVPAALCAYASLSDRWSLAAIWFPAVIWMLSILDRTHGTTSVDAVGIVFLGTLALGFIYFLRARESRRVGIWARVAPMPLATATTPALLKQSPGFGFMRAGWTLGVTAITFAITTWVAPRLWKIEVARHQLAVEMQGRGGAGLGLPCCPVAGELPVARARVREYLDLGRGHDDAGSPTQESDCRICPRTPAILPRGYDGDPIALGADTFGGNGGDAGGYSGGVGQSGYASPGITPPIVRDDIAPPRYQPPPAPAPRVTPPKPAHTPQAPVRSPMQVPPPPQVAEPTHVAPPPVASPPQPVAAVATTPPPAPPSAAMPPHAVTPDSGGSLLHWIATLLAFAAIFQIVNLSLRPFRRALTLRHLRRPLWDETVDQRVSNSWQLALVGLRDGGWRVRASETPSELARRVGITELAQCATILERARYGIQIDAGDLDQMSSSADATYGAARARISVIARAMSWLRWPLA